MNFWTSFWTIFFFASLVLFAAVAVVVAIGGFLDIGSLFKSLAERSGQSEKSSGRQTG
jgi:hypothetical protein